MRLYILQGTTPVFCDDPEVWRAWFKSPDNNCVVGDDVAGDVHVGTIFVGTHENHSGPPLLFETTVKGGKFDGEKRHYPTWQEALVGHVEIFARVKSDLT